MKRPIYKLAGICILITLWTILMLKIGAGMMEEVMIRVLTQVP